MDPVLRETAAHVVVSPAELDEPSGPPLGRDVDHHLRKVLRLRSGETVGVTDGAGRWRLTTAVVDGGTLRLEPVGPVVQVPAPERLITIATAMPKGDRLDWLVQKTTELGVGRVVLLHADRSVVRWRPDRVDRQLARLRRVADEAVRQSRRVWLPEITGPVDAASVLGGSSPGGSAPGGSTSVGFVVAEPGGRPLTVGDTFVAIGPEGGWSAAELERAVDRVGLGDTILRTETAAVAATTLCVAFDRRVS